MRAATAATPTPWPAPDAAHRTGTDIAPPDQRHRTGDRQPQERERHQYDDEPVTGVRASAETTRSATTRTPTASPVRRRVADRAQDVRNAQHDRGEPAGRRAPSVSCAVTAPTPAKKDRPRSTSVRRRTTRSRQSGPDERQCGQKAEQYDGPCRHDQCRGQSGVPADHSALAARGGRTPPRTGCAGPRASRPATRPAVRRTRSA